MIKDVSCTWESELFFFFLYLDFITRFNVSDVVTLEVLGTPHPLHLLDSDQKITLLSKNLSQMRL